MPKRQQQRFRTAFGVLVAAAASCDLQSILLLLDSFSPLAVCCLRQPISFGKKQAHRVVVGFLLASWVVHLSRRSVDAPLPGS